VELFAQVHRLTGVPKIKEMTMDPHRNTPVFSRHAAISQFGRKLLCGFIACALTVVLLGEVGQSAAQAAQRAIAEQSVSDRVAS
jgi:hypothetical protein